MDEKKKERTKTVCVFIQTSRWLLIYIRRYINWNIVHILIEYARESSS